MPEYRSPGVFVEEIPARVRPIEGVPTGTAALVGETERGALAPRLVTSTAAFQRWFGGRFAAERHIPMRRGPSSPTAAGDSSSVA
jgi:phage tail sheath protein FI